VARLAVDRRHRRHAASAASSVPDVQGHVRGKTGTLSTVIALTGCSISIRRARSRSRSSRTRCARCARATCARRTSSCRLCSRST
jgi:hypothetical protein